MAGKPEEHQAFKLPDEFRWNWGEIKTLMVRDEEISKIIVDISSRRLAEGIDRQCSDSDFIVEVLLRHWNEVGMRRRNPSPS